MNKNKKEVIKGLIILFIFSMLLNLPFIHMREFQGEEGRRVIIAQEMLRSGDYIVPRVEGEVYLNKPPLYNWYLALIFRISGEISELTARLSSVITAFFTSLFLSIFWMVVSGIKDIRFILPGIIFLTLPEVIDKAIKAEIDMTFTFFITLSILTWFYLSEIKMKKFPAYILSMGLLSFGTLTKGIQAPLFFYSGLIPYLVYRKRFRELFSFYHLTGILVYLIIFMSWFLPLIEKVELDKVLSHWWMEILVRGEPLKRGGFLRHIIEFPLEYFLKHMPWIIFLFLWKDKSLRDSKFHDLTIYSMLFLLFSVPLYSLIPGARLRYLLPLSGALVILITIPLSSIISDERYHSSLLRRFRFIFGIFIIIGMLSMPVFIYHYKISINPVMVISILFLLLTGTVLIKGNLRTEIVLTVMALSLLFMKTAWASTYFPYHKEKHSYYRNAAQWINSIVPPEAMIYDYKTGNPHLTFYLKRDIISVNGLNDAIMRNSFLMTRKEYAPELNDERLIYVGEIRARRMTIVIYRIKNHESETQG